MQVCKRSDMHYIRACILEGKKAHLCCPTAMLHAHIDHMLLRQEPNIAVLQHELWASLTKRSSDTQDCCAPTWHPNISCSNLTWHPILLCSNLTCHPNIAVLQLDLTPKHFMLQSDLTPKHFMLQVDLTPKHLMLQPDFTPRHLMLFLTWH